MTRVRQKIYGWLGFNVLWGLIESKLELVWVILSWVGLDCSKIEKEKKKKTHLLYSSM